MRVSRPQETQQSAAAGGSATDESAAAGSATAAAAPPPPPSTASGSCTLQLAAGATPQSFTGCSPIKGIGSNFNLMWKSAPVAGNPAVRRLIAELSSSRAKGSRAVHCSACMVLVSCLHSRCTATLAAIPLSLCRPSPGPACAALQKTLLTVALNATSSGYVSVGFPTKPTRMTAATAFILQACTAGSSGNCTAGAKLEQYWMSGTEESGGCAVWLDTGTLLVDQPGVPWLPLAWRQ